MIPKPLQILILGEAQSGRTMLQVLLKELLEERGHQVVCADFEKRQFDHCAWLKAAGATEHKLLPTDIEIDVL